MEKKINILISFSIPHKSRVKIFLKCIINQYFKALVSISFLIYIILTEFIFYIIFKQSIGILFHCIFFKLACNFMHMHVIYLHISITKCMLKYQVYI